MNNYISFETIDLAKKLKGYNMLFNYRMSNLCVKAEPTALMPVTVFVAGTEYNLEDVANILRPDDFSFDVYPKNQNNLQDIITGVLHVFYTMPPVDKDRRKLLNETTKTFHKECMVNLDLAYADLQARLVEPYTQMSPQNVDEARKGFKKVYDKAREECDKMLQQKLNEIEEGYQRYLHEDNELYAEQDTDDNEMEISHDAEIEALFNQ